MILKIVLKWLLTCGGMQAVAKDYGIILISSSGIYNIFDLRLFRCKNHFQLVIVINQTVRQLDHHHLIHALCFIFGLQILVCYDLWIGLAELVTIWVMDNTFYKWFVCKLGSRYSTCEKRERKRNKFKRHFQN